MYQAVPHPPAVNRVSPRCVSLGPSHSLGATQRQGAEAGLAQRGRVCTPKWVKAKVQGDGCEAGGRAPTLSGGGWGGPHLGRMVACGDLSPSSSHMYCMAGDQLWPPPGL